MDTSVTTVDDYLAKVEPDKRAALEALRRQILALVPGVEEVISYGIPYYKFDGPLVALGAAKKHCALYGMSSTLFEELGDQLAAYDTSKGTIRFQHDAPLPEALVRKIVQSRLVENKAIVEARTARKAAKKK